MNAVKTRIPEVLERHEAEIVTEWVREQKASAAFRPDLIKEYELREQSARLLRLVREAAATGVQDLAGQGWAPVREYLGELSRSRAIQGFSPTETATFVLSLKQPLFTHLRRVHEGQPELLADDLWNLTVMVDKLALHSTENFQKSREDVIRRQQNEMFELSTPVVELWRGVLGLPLIGTLDSKRTQIVMETLLTRIAETQSGVAIIDITGVPTVDTLTAQHLLKAVSAIRLMGSECIISGIRPQIAQTIVHLGIDLGGVTTKATMAAALEVALKRVGLRVTERADATRADGR